ncbi:MAG: glycosyltransferase family 4 protein [Chloroflexi bacterium]|nr:glycosyltransferase family 4 protein [Chloroflexota bacterium]
MALRLMGLSEQNLTFSNGQVYGKDRGFFNALSHHYTLAGMISVRLPKSVQAVYRMLHFRADRSRWRTASSLNAGAFTHRTRLAERYLSQRAGEYDLIVQMHTLTAAGTQPRPYVLTTDNTFLLSEKYWPEWVPLRPRDREQWIALERQVYQKAAYLFPWSEFTRQSLIHDYGIAPEKIIVTGCGAYFETDQPGAGGYDSQTALFVGAEFKRKGGQTLLTAWQQVCRKLPQAQLIIVGPRAIPHPLPPNTLYYGQINDRQRLEQVFRQAAVFVMPSIFEPWGHVFLEAMGLGLPCIGTNICAMPEIIRADETGLIVPVGDAEALAEALITLLSDPDRAQQMGRQGYAAAVEHYNWNAVAARMFPYIEQAALTGR